jgi:hypothetical protein
MKSADMEKEAAGTFFFRIAVAVVFITAGLGPAVADSLQDDSVGFDELVGTWIYTEYDGLFHHYEEVTWTADGAVVCYDSYTRTLSSDGPFTIVEKRIGSGGCLFIAAVYENAGGSGCLQIKISRCGDYYEICRNPGSGRQECRCFFRKKVYRGTPRYRFDTLRVRTRYAGYPFNPDRVIPWTKYFWAKA